MEEKDIRVPKRPFAFLQQTTNFTVVPKWPFVMLQQNTKFYISTQMGIRFHLQPNAKF